MRFYTISKLADYIFNEINKANIPHTIKNTKQFQDYLASQVSKDRAVISKIPQAEVITTENSSGRGRNTLLEEESVIDATRNFIKQLGKNEVVTAPKIINFLKSLNS